MKTADILVTQTTDAYLWMNKLIDAIPFDQWDRIPDVIQSNTTWQVGHLIVSLYYHSILAISGHQTDILREVPLREYDQLFTANEPVNSVGKMAPQTLKDHLSIMEKRSVEIIASLDSDSLHDALAPVTPQHPIASNRFEAIDWNIKHTMWHCGQLGILKRIINGRLDFGLQR